MSERFWNWVFYACVSIAVACGAAQLYLVHQIGKASDELFALQRARIERDHQRTVERAKQPPQPQSWSFTISADGQILVPPHWDDVPPLEPTVRVTVPTQ